MMSASTTQLTVAERAALGVQARKVRSRRAMADFTSAPHRADPVKILVAQEDVRVADLLPLRHERMSMSSFAFLRGGAAIMAADLGAMPNTGLNVQLCGDAHLSNLGLFAAPDRRLVFDVNDFDETNPGPFEWDVMRLATSFVVAASAAGHTATFTASLPAVVASSYRKAMQQFADMNELDIWYYRLDTTLLAQWARRDNEKGAVRALRSTERVAMSRDRWSAVAKLTTVVNGVRKFRDQPPLLVSLDENDVARDVVSEMYDSYRSTLLVDRAALLARYNWIDAGHKVVGVGSVGLLAFVGLLEGKDDRDLLVLQIKQAVSSVLEPFSGTSTYATHGERVVAGQRLIQASPDSFLGWVEGDQGRNYYVRQLRDMKWAPDPLAMNRRSYEAYATLCGLALARAHARSGDSVALAAYLGSSDRFDRSMAAFAQDYARQNEQDFAQFTSAIASGAIVANSEEKAVPQLGLKE